MEYIKNLKYLFIRDKTISEGIGKRLTKDQRKRYRYQYFRIVYSVLIFSIVYMIATTELMYLFFEGHFWALVVVILLLRDYYKLACEWSRESELIQERMHRRNIKNLKQKAEVRK